MSSKFCTTKKGFVFATNNMKVLIKPSFFNIVGALYKGKIVREKQAKNLFFQ